MEHDRFDDVEVRFVHDPDAPQQPPRRRRRWVAMAAAAAVAAGGFAAVASAGGDAPGPATKPAAKSGRGTYPDGVYQHMRRGKPCDREGKRLDREGTRHDRGVSYLY